jgi:hypothetical protein
VIFINALSKCLLFFLVLVYYQLRQSEPGIIILVNVVVKKSPDLKPLIEIIMKLKYALTAVALTSVFSTAFASNLDLTVDFGINPTAETYFHENLQAGTFNDNYTFSLNKGSDTLGAASFLQVTVRRLTTDFFSIDPFSIALYSGMVGNGVLVPPTDTLGTTNTTRSNYLDFADGNYFYNVKGTVLTNNSSLANYTFKMTNGVAEQLPPSPVPEPETYAMMLAGLGLLGFTARRKAKANQS